MNRLLDALTDTYRLMAGLLYGSGVRLMECMRLRVKKGGNMKQTWARAARSGLFVASSGAEVPQRRTGNGSGSTCFRRAGCQWTLEVERYVGIISMKMLCNELLRIQPYRLD